MQIVSEHQINSALQKQIVQMRWGKPYGTVIPATERRLAAKMSQKEIALRMNVRLPTVEQVLSKYWRVSDLVFSNEPQNGFRYPRREYNIGPKRLVSSLPLTIMQTDEGKDWLLVSTRMLTKQDFDNLKKYGAISLEGRCIMLEQNFPGCDLNRYSLSELFKDADFSKRVLATGLQTSLTPIVSAMGLLVTVAASMLPFTQQRYFLLLLTPV